MLDLFVVRGNEIEAPGVPIKEAYYELRTAIMDAKIPVSMPIGFKIVTPNSLDSITAVERNSACLESMVAISTNVKDILFVGEHGIWVQSEPLLGQITTGNAAFRSNDKQEVEAVDKTVLMLTAVEQLRIRFFVYTAMGYHSMEENSSVMGENGFFPLNTSHSLLSYIRVLPFDGKSIRVVYKRGMTADIFARILKGGTK